MTRLTRSEVQRIADAWSDRPEGVAGSPVIALRFTPAAVLLLMDWNGSDAVEGVIEPTHPPIASDGLRDGPEPFAEAKPAPDVPARSGPSYAPHGAPSHRHPFRGRSDRDCETCGRPDRASIHQPGPVMEHGPAPDTDP